MQDDEKKSMRSLPLLLAVLLLSGCVSYVRIPDKNNTPVVAGGTPVCLATVDPHVGVEVQQSNISGVVGGGLVGALVDISIEAHRGSVAKDKVAFVQAEADKWAYETLEQVLRDKLSVLPSGPTELLVCGGDNAKGRRPLAMAKGHPILVIKPDFYFSVGQVQICLVATADLFGADGSPLYHNVFLVKTMSCITDSVDANSNKLTPAEESAFREALVLDCTELVRLLTYDLTRRPADDPTSGNPPTTGYYGTIIRNSDGRTWARDKDGTLASYDRVDTSWDLANPAAEAKK